MDAEILGWVIFLVIILGGIVKFVTDKNDLADAEKVYQDRLEALRNDPSNSQLREAALKSGRALAKVGRRINEGAKRQQVIVHDEDVIRNDLEAITAGAMARTSSVADEIKKLAMLHRDGIITIEEFGRLKQQLAGKPSGVNDVIRLLRGLKDLEREGALTESEFNMKKWDILSRRTVRGA